MLLNAKQEKFVQNIISGMTQRQAYKKAYKAKYSEKSIDEKACVLFNSEKVQKRYKELLGKVEDKTIMSAQERMEWLTGVIKNQEKEEIYIKSEDGKVKVRNKNADLSTKIKAIDTLNKMSGEYKTIVDGSLEVSKKLEDLL